MDPILKKLEYLTAIARERPEPPFAPGCVLERIDGLSPDSMTGEYTARLFFDMAVVAGTAAAVIAIVAFSAWVDLHNPFLALETLGNVLERL